MISTFLISIVTLLSSWQFAHEQVSNQMPTRDDLAWHTVSVPHEYNEPVCAWYKTRLTIRKNSLDNGNHFVLQLDGAAQNTCIYLNGTRIGDDPFTCPVVEQDITSALRPGDNELSIRVENTGDTPAGLYRTIRLTEYPRTHISLGSTQIWTKEIRENGQAVIGIRGDVTTPIEKGVKVKVEVSMGTEKYYFRTRVYQKGVPFEHEALIPFAHLWSPESPNLYYVTYTLYEGFTEVEQHVDTFGIRTVEYTANDSLRLNGKNCKLKGVCLPTDPGMFGRTLRIDALRQQLKQLQDMGCNAVRTQVIPAPEFVQLCDEMGLMLTIDLHQSDAWSKKDLSAIVSRYRNHPSVIFWTVDKETASICQREDPSRHALPIDQQTALSDKENLPYDTWTTDTYYYQLINRATIPTELFYQYRSRWNEKSHTLQILPHWTWTKGETATIEVYTDLRTDLQLNGKSLAVKGEKWQVPFEPGRLQANGYNNSGQLVKVAYLRTAEDPLYIELVPTTYGRLTYVRIRILDVNNTLCPHADNEVTLTVTGKGTLLGACNGNPNDPTPFLSTTQRACHGELTAVIQGEATLTVTAKDIQSGSIRVAPKTIK